MHHNVPFTDIVPERYFLHLKEKEILSLGMGVRAGHGNCSRKQEVFFEDFEPQYDETWFSQAYIRKEDKRLNFFFGKSHENLLNLHSF